MTKAEIKKAFACLDCGKDTGKMGEYYMVKHELWRMINPQITGMLCIGCLEHRFGRKLIHLDFLYAPINFFPDQYRSKRLLSRLFT